MQPLKGKVAVVAGGSRGAGRGIALALGDAGATVYVLGRSTRTGPKPADGAPGTIDDTADEVSRRGGVGITIRADCTIESDVAAAFDQVTHEQGKLDILANAVWGGGDAITSMEDWQSSWGKPFYEQSIDHWHYNVNAGPYAYFLASHHAARRMAPVGHGLIVGVTDFVFPGQEEGGDYGSGQLISQLAHDWINRLLRGMAGELKPRGVAVMPLMPGFMRTERVLRYLQTEEQKKMFGFDRSESTEYIGRAVAALAADAKVIEKTGKVQFVGELAREYGFTDVDGKYIPPFTPHG